MQFFPVLLMVLAMFSHLAAADQFGSSCRSTSMSGSTLWAYCTKEDGHEKWSKVDLNQCLLNDNGQMKWAAGGYYYPSCSYWGCSYSEQTSHQNTYTYSCWCQTNDKKWKDTSVFLNTRISNNNGDISCDL